MPTIVNLPSDWNKVKLGPPLVDAGRYVVTVEKMSEDSGIRISAEFQILDEGPFSGWKLFESFSLDTDTGKRSFKEFLAALSVEDENLSVDLDVCLQKKLRLTVVHKPDKKGRTWVNVRRHESVKA